MCDGDPARGAEGADLTDGRAQPARLARVLGWRDGTGELRGHVAVNGCAVIACDERRGRIGEEETFDGISAVFRRGDDEVGARAAVHALQHDFAARHRDYAVFGVKDVRI